MDTSVESLGECKINNPLKQVDWVEDTDRVLYNISAGLVEECVKKRAVPNFLLKSGPEKKNLF